MEQRTWVIYKHTLVEDCEHYGWSYIGQTSTPAKIRWKSGYGYRKGCQVFRSAIDKHSWENFTHEIIEDGIQSVEEANEREKYWIAHYHTYIGDSECRGYNMTPGGGAHDMVKQTIERDGEVLKVFVSELPRFEAEGWRVLSKKEVKKLWYEANKEKLAEKRRDYMVNYREEHREELLAKKKMYAKENREKVKAKQREWMQENEEHIKAQKAVWREANKEAQQEKAKLYYAENRERIIQRVAKYSQEKKEEIKAYKKEYARKNHDKILEYKREYQRKYRARKKLEEAKNEENQSG